MVQSLTASVQRIDRLLTLEPQIRDDDDALPQEKGPRQISFDGASLVNRDRVLLDNISFTVEAGETIGVIGPSGSGKTTLLNLLVRFYDPTSGSVRFDGVDLRKIRLDDLYSQVAIVLQQPFLFAASVLENIRCGRPSATDDEVVSAARAAQIHAEILHLPSGYETRVGHGGQRLSVGQEQRINIARALLKDAPILLLDEATSALDSIAEADVQTAIDALMAGRTTFIAAHRLSTLRRASRTLVLDHGRLVGFGSHGELLESCEVYRRSWAAQKMPGSEL
jgi:ATP-binding cassette subfamily B protein